MSESVPDYFGALTGWRRFDLGEQDRILLSVNHPFPWASADIGEAMCVVKGPMAMLHDATPAFGCWCGYHSYKSKADAIQHGQGFVLARVEIWGRIVEHARGYRSARMKITAISVPTGFDQIAALEKRYACPVTQEDLWISENPNASSSSNPYQSPFVSPSWTYPPFIIPNLPASPNVSSQSQWNAQLAQYQQNYQQAFAAMQAQLNATPRVPYVGLLGSGVVSGFVSGSGNAPAIVANKVADAAVAERARLIAERIRKDLFDDEDDSTVRYAEWEAAWTDPKQPKV